MHLKETTIPSLDSFYCLYLYKTVHQTVSIPRWQYVFFGVMVLFFRLIMIILFKMNIEKNDFEKLTFSSFDLQNILLTLFRMEGPKKVPLPVFPM